MDPGYVKASYLTIFPYFIAFGLSFFLSDIPLEKSDEMYIIRNLFFWFMEIKNMILFLISSALILETTHTISIFYN